MSDHCHKWKASIVCYNEKIITKPNAQWSIQNNNNKSPCAPWSHQQYTSAPHFGNPPRITHTREAGQEWFWRGKCRDCLCYCTPGWQVGLHRNPRLALSTVTCPKVPESSTTMQSPTELRKHSSLDHGDNQTMLNFLPTFPAPWSPPSHQEVETSPWPLPESLLPQICSPVDLALVRGRSSFISCTAG